MSFLEIEVKLQEGYLQSEVYTKATDKRAYLNALPCHPKHCKDNIPFNQLLRVRRLCSKEESFDKQCRDMRDDLLLLGYQTFEIDKAETRAKQTPRSETLQF